MFPKKCFFTSARGLEPESGAGRVPRFTHLSPMMPVDRRANSADYKSIRADHNRPGGGLGRGAYCLLCGNSNPSRCAISVQPPGKIFSQSGGKC
jgi:hypothetical protein